MVPFHAAFHERNTAALVRVRDHATRPAGFEWDAAKRADQRTHVMSVNRHNSPTKRAPTVRQWFQTHGVFRSVALLQAVSIDDDGQIVEPELRGGHGGFPVAAFLQLAVTGQHKCPPYSASELS